MVLGPERRSGCFRVGPCGREPTVKALQYALGPAATSRDAAGAAVLSAGLAACRAANSASG